MPSPKVGMARTYRITPCGVELYGTVVEGEWVRTYTESLVGTFDIKNRIVKWMVTRLWYHFGIALVD